MTNHPTLATHSELAQILGVTDRTIRNWIHRGRLIPAGDWTPRGGRTIPLYAVSEARTIQAHP